MVDHYLTRGEDKAQVTTDPRRYRHHLLRLVLCLIAAFPGACRKQLADHAPTSTTTHSGASAGANRERDGEVMRRVIDVAKETIDGRGISTQIYPEPVQVAERGDHWEVSFAYRDKLVYINGKQTIQKQKPAWVRVEVRKLDMTGTIILGR